MAQGIIRPTKSPWASPLQVVKKSNGEYRPYGDYRRLNSVTIPDRYPVSHIQDCTLNLYGKTVFTTLDLARAYHQIAINPPDIAKTVVTAPFGLFEYTAMPFGLRNFAEAKAPLNKLLTNCKKNNDKRPVPWNEEAEPTFKQCKSSLTNVVKLNYPTPDQQLCLLVDAFNSAVGGALNCLTENGPQPIAFFSCKLSATETKYSTYDRELLAIYLAIKHFRPQLEGHNFKIFTDHRPLTFAFNKISDSYFSRQLRHLDFISQFSTNIRHVPGSDNSVADALSRINGLNLSTTDLEDLADSQTKDEELKTLISSNDLFIKLKPLKMGNALEIFCDDSREKVRPFFYVPEELRFEVFRSLHNLSHPGIRATKRLIQDRFVWPSMLKDITKWTRCCIPCQRSKFQRHTVSPLQPFAPTVERFQHVHIDVVGPFPPSDGFTFLLTCIDRYTRWPEIIPVSDISAEAVAKSFIANWISRFGVPAIITTDRGGQFQHRLLYSLKSMLGIQRIRTTPYHPSSNGMVERLHRTLKHSIRCHDTKWTESLPVVLLVCERASIRTSMHPALKWCLEKPLCFQENSLNLQVRPQLIPLSFS
ncbi:transposon Tf2-8 polyprotein [Trichonephila clavipes]|nr:transposon Tf2-8 polyprotein [Trichonephila clavipes]